jgi:hypothetical protein
MWAKRACLFSFRFAVYVLRHILEGPRRHYYFGNFQTRHLLSVINSRPRVCAGRIQIFFQLTSWCRIVLGKSIVIQLAMKFPDCYGTQKLLGTDTKACHWNYLGTCWRWVVSFTPRPLYPRGKSPRLPLDRRLDDVENRKSWPLGGPARSQTLYRLRYPGLFGEN